jgi:putative tryptophan/tyrosine transport system substrate-binding protein
MVRAPIIRRAVAVILALGVLAAPLALEAQQAEKVWRIGVFHVGDHIPPGLQTLRDGLKALGYEEGKNLQLDFRNLADEEAASRTAREFVQSRPDLIVTFGNPAARAARAVTSEIPIVMVNVADPVAQGLVMSLARPGGNATGFVFFAVSLPSTSSSSKRWSHGFGRYSSWSTLEILRHQPSWRRFGKRPEY